MGMRISLNKRFYKTVCNRITNSLGEIGTYVKLSYMAKDEILYDDFSKLDIRIGTIVAAELVPETDKLIKCTVDLGDPPSPKATEGQGKNLRTIVSGLAEYITPDELVGKQCPYVANLAPRTIRDIESQGMILAIGLEDDFVLLHPNKEVPAGSSIG